MRGLSIRVRLVAGMVVPVSLGLAVANATVILVLRSYLLDRVDEQVASIAGPGTNATPPDSPPGGALCANPRDPRGLRSDFALMVLDAEGDVACSLGPELGDAGPDLAAVGTLASNQLETVTSVDGSERWRLRVVDLEQNGQKLVLAVSLADADATVERLTWISVSISLLVLALTAAAAGLITGIGLRPLTRIEETAERIAAGDLTQRVPTSRPRTEVGRLSLAVNGMLGQIERAFDARSASEARLRRFVSDASHELRTPLATIRGHAELWRNGFMREEKDLTTVVGRIESESMRMGALVDDMLLLARLDQARPLARRPVDLLSLAADAVVDAEAVQPARRIDLAHESVDDPPVVSGDEARLRQVFANLLSNALTHTPVASRVTVSVTAGGDDVVVSVSDEGPGMSPEVSAQVFERFYRADPSRSHQDGGTGLGLAIVKSIVTAHGGSVACESSVADGSTFTMRFGLRDGRPLMSKSDPLRLPAPMHRVQRPL